MSNDLEYNLGLNTGPFQAAGDQAVAASGHIAGQIAKKFEFRDIGRTLATALGVSLENIAEHVARLFTGLSKEQEAALANAAALGEKTTAIYRQIYAARNTLDQNLKGSEKDQNQLLRERQTILDAIAARQKIYSDAKAIDDRGAINEAKRRNADQTQKEKIRLDEIALALAEKQLSIEEQGRQKKEKDLAYQRELQEDVVASIAQEQKQFDINIRKGDEELAKRKLSAEDMREFDILSAKRLDGTINPLERERLKILTLQTKQKQINADIDLILQIPIAQRTKDQSNTLASLFKQNDAISKQINLLNDAAHAGGGVAAVAEKVTEEFHFALGQLKSFVDEWTGFTTSVTTMGRGNGALSDRELQRKISNTQSDIMGREAGLLSGFGGVGNQTLGPYDPFLGAQRSNLSQAQAELNFRNKVRSEVAAFGEDRAFAMNGGLTESRLREIIGTATDNSRAADLQQKTYDLLLRGIVTIPKA